jgi:hypothetical protein
MVCGLDEKEPVMSKSKAIGAILGALVLSCMPALATTISSGDDVQIRLGGAREVSPFHYEMTAGRAVGLEVLAHPGDVMYIFVVEIDPWGEPDYGNILPLFLGSPPGGLFAQLFEIPSGLEGRIFQLMAITLDSKGEFHSSNQLTLAILGALILTPGPAPLPGQGLSQPIALPE